MGTVGGGRRSSRDAKLFHLVDGVDGLLAEPAPYNCPPLNFSARRVWLVPGFETEFPVGPGPVLFLRPQDDSISWAGKTFLTTSWRGWTGKENTP